MSLNFEAVFTDVDCCVVDFLSSDECSSSSKFLLSVSTFCWKGGKDVGIDLLDVHIPKERFSRLFVGEDEAMEWLTDIDN